MRAPIDINTWIGPAHPLSLEFHDSKCFSLSGAQLEALNVYSSSELVNAFCKKVALFIVIPYCTAEE